MYKINHPLSGITGYITSNKLKLKILGFLNKHLNYWVSNDTLPSNNSFIFHSFSVKQCQVLNLSLSSDTILFGTAQVPNGVPHIFTTNGILHFMKKSGQVLVILK